MQLLKIIDLQLLIHVCSVGIFYRHSIEIDLFLENIYCFVLLQLLNIIEIPDMYYRNFL
jgi:hypothetical protein